MNVNLNEVLVLLELGDGVGRTELLHLVPQWLGAVAHCSLPLLTAIYFFPLGLSGLFRPVESVGARQFQRVLWGQEACRADGSLPVPTAITGPASSSASPAVLACWLTGGSEPPSL